MAALLVVALASLAILSAPARATSPGLQLNPLRYEDTMVGSNVRSGHIDVANPSDTTVSIVASVQGFKQIDLAGNLQFFTDPVLEQGIVLGLTKFDLGPRESVRVAFSVNPTKLPKGGVYATVFFRTLPPNQTSNTSFVAESANVGTLLLLQNGPVGQHQGRVSQFDLPFWQFGHGLSGRGQYQNTDRTTTPVGFAPELSARILPWGKPTKLTGPYVLPGSTRQFVFDRPGSYFGLMPVGLRDTASGQITTRWVFACTGWYGWVALVAAVVLALVLAYRFIRRRFRRKPKPSHRPLDGLSRRSD